MPSIPECLKILADPSREVEWDAAFAESTRVSDGDRIWILQLKEALISPLGEEFLLRKIFAMNVLLRLGVTGESLLEELETLAVAGSADEKDFAYGWIIKNVKDEELLKAGLSRMFRKSDPPSLHLRVSIVVSLALRFRSLRKAIRLMRSSA